MTYQKKIDNALTSRNALIEKLDNMGIDDMEVMKGELAKEIEKYQHYRANVNFHDTEKKVRIGLYALKMKAICKDEEELASKDKRESLITWKATQKWLRDKLNLGAATLYSYAYMARFSDALEFTEYGTMKLLKLTKNLGRYADLMARVDISFSEMSFYSIKDISTKIMKKLSVETMNQLHDKVVAEPSILMKMALDAAAKGKSFEDEVLSFKEDIPFTFSKKLVEAMTHEVPDVKKIKKILDYFRKKNTLPVRKIKLTKLRKEVEELYRQERCPENELKLKKCLDKMEKIARQIEKVLKTENAPSQVEAA